MDAAWGEVARAAEIPVGGLARARQVHGADVFLVPAGHIAGEPFPQADIILSADPSAGLAIQTADCVPLLLVDRRTGARAAAHAGWRGLAAGVPGLTVGAMARAFGSRPEDLLAVAGPSIGACCYEVGAEVHERFAAAFSGRQIAGWFHPQPTPTATNPSMRGLPSPLRDGHWYFDG